MMAGDDNWLDIGYTDERVTVKPIDIKYDNKTNFDLLMGDDGWQ